jgi:hypothetical protein
MRRRNIHKIKTRRDPKKNKNKSETHTHTHTNLKLLFLIRYEIQYVTLQTCFSHPSFSY